MSITSTVVNRADTQFVEAPEVLRPYVGCFWIITAQPGAAIRVVPDATTSISIQLTHGKPAGGWALRGPLTRPQERRFSEPATVVGIRLRPGVAFLVTGVEAHAMVERRIRLSGLPCDGSHIDELQRFLIDRLRGAFVHLVIARAIEVIQQEGGCTRVAQVAAACGVSERHLNRLMRTWVGYGPKRLSRIVRFQTTLHQMEEASVPKGAATLAAVAAEAGYFDQAHLTLDVNRLAGATPGQLTSRHVADFYKTRCDQPL